MTRFFFLTSLILVFTCPYLYSEDQELPEAKSIQYQYTLAMTAIFRDEAPYLKEWIEFHHMVGVEHFYMINNLSVDNYLEVLHPYMESGLVELIEWPYEHAVIYDWNLIQCRAYEYVINEVQGKVKWLAIIDTDEFLFAVKKDNLTELLSKYEKFGGLAVNWQVFGTSDVSKVAEDELLIEKLIMKLPQDADVNRHVKSIVRPEWIAGCDNPHYMLYKNGKFQVASDRKKFIGPFSPDIQLNVIRINHYTIRDEYYLHHFKLPRVAKWDVDVAAVVESYKLFNQVQDESIFRFIPRLKTCIRKKEGCQ